jgi:hypothetical protein
MAKYEIEKIEDFIREMKRIGAKTVGVTTNTNAEGMGRMKSAIILTTKTEKENPDFYVCSELVASGTVSNDEDFKNLYADVEKHVTAVIEDIKKQVPACYIIRGRIIP